MPALNERLMYALADYGEKIKKDGWRAGENLISEYEKEFQNFRELANALAIVLRAYEILEEGQGQG